MNFLMFYIVAIFCAYFQTSVGFLLFDGEKVYLFNVDSEYRLQQKNPIRNVAEKSSALLSVRTKHSELLYSFKGTREKMLQPKNVPPLDIATKDYKQNLEDNALAILTYELRSYRKYLLKTDTPPVMLKKIRLPMGTCNATIVIERRSHLTSLTATASAKNCLISRKFMAALRLGHTSNTVIDDIQNELFIEYSNRERQIKEMKVTSFVDTHVRDTKIHTVRKVAMKYVGAVLGITDWEQALLMTELSKDRRA
ncbi:uncharacterized protein LOC134831833 [Culicoides brevitarsis]|uniref:uncharacterized protein LOC134831833 n=1 Tax=Culicoides brevitarsis TaxID=469753 RepID=UPI00307C48CB